MVKGRSWPPLGMLFLIFAISGEQLSLNVAGDSAKTLSVLGNMGGVLDDAQRTRTHFTPQHWLLCHMGLY